MKIEKLLEMGLTEEQANAILAMNEENLNKTKIELGVENALIKHNAKNLKAVSALIDFDKITNNDGKIQGIEEQIQALKAGQETAFLFGNNDKTVFGANAEEGKDRGKPKNVRKMTYTEMCRNSANI